MVFQKQLEPRPTQRLSLSPLELSSKYSNYFISVISRLSCRRLQRPPTNYKHSDGAWYRYDRGSGACNEQTEGGDADAVFLLKAGATLRNVIIGANQAEGVHCDGHCNLEFGKQMGGRHAKIRS